MKASSDEASPLCFHVYLLVCIPINPIRGEIARDRVHEEALDLGGGGGGRAREGGERAREGKTRVASPPCPSCQALPHSIPLHPPPPHSTLTDLMPCLEGQLLSIAKSRLQLTGDLGAKLEPSLITLALPPRTANLTTTTTATTNTAAASPQASSAEI